MPWTEDQIIEMGLRPKATYGGKVASFTCADTGDYVWSIDVLADVLPLIQRRTITERNKKLKALFAAQSKGGNR